MINSNENNISDFPILYTFRRCPFAIRARAAIYFSQTKVEVREILLNSKPKEMLDISPKGTVPVLQLKDKILEQSLDIMIWALKIQDKHNLLNPYYKKKEELLSIINNFDSYFKYHLDRYKYSSRYINDDSFIGKNKHREKALEILVDIEKSLLNKKLYLHNNKLSIMDLALFPLIRQFRNADTEWFDNNKNIIHIKKWLENLINSIFFKKVMYKYALWNKNDNKVFYNLL